MNDKGLDLVHEKGFAPLDAAPDLFKLINRIAVQASKEGARRQTLESQYKEADNKDARSSFMSALSGFRNIGGTEGKAVNRAIDKFHQSVEARGGAEISGGDLTKLLGGLREKIGAIQTPKSSIGAELLGNLHSTITEAMVASGKGFKGLTGESKRIEGVATKASEYGVLESARKDLATQITETAKSIGDSRIGIVLRGVVERLNKASEKAQTLEEKKKALDHTTQELSYLKEKHKKGQDAGKLDSLGEKAKTTVDSAKENAKELKANRVGGKLANTLTKASQAVGRFASRAATGASIGMAAKRGFDFVAGKMNDFAGLQMNIARERGAIGRNIRGAGIGASDMMASLSSGRISGMSDQETVSSMVGLETQLAAARWGEGSLIDSAGRWGLSVYDAQGGMKSGHDLMREVSRKFNTLGSDSEKLQFLSHMNFSANQREYVENYDRLARRREEIERNPTLKTALEEEDTIDASGFYAKADAHTEIVKKRREKELEKAAREGYFSYQFAKLKPEYLAGLSDYTAQQEGFQYATAETSMDKLTRALDKLGTVVEKDGQGRKVIAKEKQADILNIEELRSLSFAGAKNRELEQKYGERSHVHAMKKMFAAHGQITTSQQQQEKNKLTGALGWGAVGLIGAGALASVLTGGLAAPIIAGLVGGAAGGLFGHAKNKNEISGTMFGSRVAMLEEAQEAAEDNDEWEAFQHKYNLYTIKRRDAREGNLDIAALEGAMQTQIQNDALELTGGKAVNWEDFAFDKYFKHRTKNMNPASKEYRREMTLALARTADSSIGRGEALSEIKDISYFSENIDMETEQKAQEYAKARGGSVTEADKSKARKEVTQKYKKEIETYAPEMVQSHIDKAKQQEESFKANVQTLVKEYTSEKLHGRTSDDYETWLGKAKQGAFYPKITEAARAEDRYMQSNKKAGYEINDKGEVVFDKDSFTSEEQKEEEATRLAFRTSSALLRRENLGDRHDKVMFKNSKAGGKRGIIKRQLQEMRGDDLDLAVAKIAMKYGASEDEIKGHLISGEEAMRIATDPNSSDIDKKKLEMFNSSSIGKRLAEKKETISEKQLKKDMARAAEHHHYGESAKRDAILKSYKGMGKTEEEKKIIQQKVKAEYETAKRETRKAGTADEKMKRRYRGVVSRGLGLSSEERALFQKEQEEEKEKILKLTGGNEGQYKLFKDIEGRMFRSGGGSVSQEEQNFYGKIARKLYPLQKAKQMGSQGGFGAFGGGQTKEEVEAMAEVFGGAKKSKRGKSRGGGYSDAAKADFKDMQKDVENGASDEYLKSAYGEERFRQFKHDKKRKLASRPITDADTWANALGGGVVARGGKLYGTDGKEMTREKYKNLQKEKIESAASGLSEEGKEKMLADKMAVYDGYTGANTTILGEKISRDKETRIEQLAGIQKRLSSQKADIKRRKLSEKATELREKSGGALSAEQEAKFIKERQKIADEEKKELEEVDKKKDIDKAHMKKMKRHEYMQKRRYVLEKAFAGREDAAILVHDKLKEEMAAYDKREKAEEEKKNGTVKIEEGNKYQEIAERNNKKYSTFSAETRKKWTDAEFDLNLKEDSATEKKKITNWVKTRYGKRSKEEQAKMVQKHMKEWEDRRKAQRDEYLKAEGLKEKEAKAKEKKALDEVAATKDRSKAPEQVVAQNKEKIAQGEGAAASGNAAQKPAEPSPEPKAKAEAVGMNQTIGTVTINVNTSAKDGAAFGEELRQYLGNLLVSAAKGKSVA